MSVAYIMPSFSIPRTISKPNNKANIVYDGNWLEIAFKHTQKGAPESLALVVMIAKFVRGNWKFE